MISNYRGYPGYLITAINEMVSELGHDLVSRDAYTRGLFSTDQRYSRAWNIGLRAFKELINDRDLLNIVEKALQNTTDYRDLQQIQAIEEGILIREGMNPEAARLVLELAMSAMISESIPIDHEIWLYQITRDITLRRLFYIIGGAAIIGLNAISGLNEPTIQVSYALGGALIGKA